MTSQQLHDALNHLPEDLIAEADARRSAPPKVIPFRRYAAMAAGFAVVLSCSLFALNLVSRGGAKEAAAEVRMAGEMEENAAAPILEDTASDVLSQAVLDAAPREERAAEAPADKSQITASGTSERAVCTVTALADGETWLLPENNAAVLEQFLSQLAFDPTKVCNCLAEYRLETGAQTGYEINLTEGFVRTAQGQALLTELQMEELRGILQLPEVTP